MKVIYLDVYFFINFLMDFFVLLVLRLILKEKCIIRLVPAAMTGAIYACIVLVADLSGIIWNIITYVVISAVMITISFGFDKKSLIKKTAMLFLVTFSFNGAVNILYTKIPFWPIMILVCFLTVYLLLKIFVEYLYVRETACRVVLRHNGKIVSLEAIVDTGNSLVEPLSGKPVSVVSKNTIIQLGLKDLSKELVRIIPFNSVGKEKGILIGVQIDYMEINKKGLKITVTKPMLGIYENKLSANGKYSMLLHPQVAKK